METLPLWNVAAGTQKVPSSLSNCPMMYHSDCLPSDNVLKSEVCVLFLLLHGLCNLVCSMEPSVCSSPSSSFKKQRTIWSCLNVLVCLVSFLLYFSVLSEKTDFLIWFCGLLYIRGLKRKEQEHLEDNPVIQKSAYKKKKFSQPFTCHLRNMPP